MDTDSLSIASSPFPLPEFTLIRVLKHGLKELYANLKIIDELFPTLPGDVRRELMGYLDKHQNIQVVHNFPTRGTQLPIISLSLAAESEDQSKETLNYHVDELVDKIGVDVTEAQALAMRSTYNIMVFTQDRDFTIHLYNLLKALLLLNLDYLVINGLHEIQISGSDFRFEDDNYFPAFAYSRNLSLSALHYDTVLTKSKALRTLLVTISTDPSTVVSSIELPIGG